MREKTVKCYICGKLYKFISDLVKDQSACPDCVREAKKNMKIEERRKFIFG